MSQQLKVQKSIQTITGAFSKGVFKNFIEYIRFPRFKNLQDNVKIDFSFPLTVFTGLNGSGKSSTLHAIYGAPEGFSTGEFWFSTNVDPISDTKEAPNCYIYGYKSATNDILEVLKTRVGQAKGADYWEPSRPLAKYNMQRLLLGKRNPTIKKNVIYLDFRAELSAFDQYFYFGKFRSTKNLKSKRDVLRKYSKPLKRAIDGNTIITNGKRKNKAPVTLNAAELKVISTILGKQYQQCSIVEHDFYGQYGYTVYFKTNNLNYSEAYAGRGEFAVAKLVYEISRAQEYSLVILDEPEVSLHPGAQSELKLFLLDAIIKKKLQIVICTHSPVFVEYLPDNAIKLFLEDSGGKFIVKNSCSYYEAFQNIGLELKPGEKNVIIVEDVTAKLIIEAILQDLGTEYPLLFEVRFYPGGASEIYKKAAAYSEEGEYHKFIYLDGDQNKPKYDPSAFSTAESNDFAFLNATLQAEVGVTFEKLGFRVDGNSANGGSEAQKKKSALTYFTYLKENLHYLPGDIPESIIWTDAFAETLLKSIGKSGLNYSNDSKKNFYEFTQAYFGDALEGLQTASKKLFINEFVKTKQSNYQLIADTLNRMKTLVTTHTGN